MVPAMDSPCRGGRTLGQFALVSYLSDPLASFLDRLRLDLDPKCSPHAHVTILPPRPMTCEIRDALNQLADENSFRFAHPDCIGAVPSSADNFRSHRAIVPPRFNKKYAQHPIARIIIDGIVNFRPDILTFWGVGLTDSDADLLDVYRKWIASTSLIEVINPDVAVTDRTMGMFKKDIRHYSTLEEWLG